MFEVKERHLIRKQKKNLQAAHLIKTYRKIKDELETSPLKPTHHFEILEKRSPKPNLYSKRISRSHRVVYSVDKNDEIVTVYSAWGHYESGNQSLIHHRL